MQTQDKTELYERMQACLLNLYDRGIIMECDGDAFDELEEIAQDIRNAGAK